MKHKIAVGFLTILFVFASSVPSVSAQTTTTASVQALLEQIKTLQAQLAELMTLQQKVTESLQLIRSLRQGMSGDDVSALQAILAADPSIYPEGIISGYYGALTAKAVKKFQERNGIEGLGFVGPRTLEKLNKELSKNRLSREDDSEEDDDEDGDGWRGRHLCAIVPPGHFIAPGWLKKQNGNRPIIPTCQELPKGIEKKIDDDDDDDDNGTTIPPVVDTTAPVLTDIRSNDVASTTANIKWTTNENANGKVWYGTTTPVTFGTTTSTVSHSNFVKNHTLGLTGLTASSTYYYVVVSSDSSGNTATSSQNSFLTLP